MYICTPQNPKNYLITCVNTRNFTVLHRDLLGEILFYLTHSHFGGTEYLCCIFEVDWTILRCIDNSLWGFCGTEVERPCSNLMFSWGLFGEVASGHKEGDRWVLGHIHNSGLWAVGWAVLWKKRFRPIMSNFWGLFFYVFMGKKIDLIFFLKIF